jgi:hypothetical protein
MRLVLMLTSLLIVSILIFKGYSNSMSTQHDALEGEQSDPIKKAKEVEQLILDAASTRQQEIEKQIQQ